MVLNDEIVTYLPRFRITQVWNLKFCKYVFTIISSTSVSIQRINNMFDVFIEFYKLTKCFGVGKAETDSGRANQTKLSSTNAWLIRFVVRLASKPFNRHMSPEVSGKPVRAHSNMDSSAGLHNLFVGQLWTI